MRDLPIDLTTQKSYSPDYQNYDFDETGIADVAIWGSPTGATQVRDRFFKNLRNLYRNLGDNDRESAFADCQAIEVLSPYWAAFAVKAWQTENYKTKIETQNFDLVKSARFPLLNTIWNGEEPANDIFLNRLCGKPTEYPAWRWPLRMVWQYIRQSPIRSMPAMLTSYGSDIVTVVAGHQQDTHLTGGHRVVGNEHSNWFGQLDPALLSVQRQLTDDLMTCAINAMGETGVTTGFLLSNWLERQFELSANVVNGHLAKLALKKKLPRKMWIGTDGNPWNRLLAYEVKRRRGQVTAFDHGVGIGLYEEEYAALMFESICTRFATFSVPHKKAMQSCFAKSALDPAKLPEVIVPDTMEMKSLQCSVLIENVPQSEPKSISKNRAKRILFIPLALTGELFHIVPYPADLAALDYTSRLLGILTTAGFEVTLKPHPEFSFPDAEIWQQKFSTPIETEPFEAIFNDYDVLLFGYPTTSTLRPALESGKPLVILDPQPSNWNDGSLNAVKQKAEFLRVKSTEHGRLICDGEAICSAINRAVEASHGG